MVKIICGICGALLRDGKWIFSRFTQEHYCPPEEWTKCAEREEAISQGRKRAAA